MRWPDLQALPYRLLRWLGLGPGLYWLAAWLVNDRFLIGVDGVVRDDQGRLLLFRHTYKRVPWGLPGGWMARGESPLEGLEREVREESGLVVEASRLLLVGTTPDRPMLEFVVEARLVGGSFRPSHEVDAIQWWPADQAPPIPPSQRRILADCDRLPPGEVGRYVNHWHGRTPDRR